MDTRRLIWRFILSLALLILMGGTLSCGQEVQTGPRAWIDFPRDKSTVPVGTPVAIISHAYARDGVAEVLLSVDGEVYRRDPPAQPGAPFSQVTQEWLPQEEGIYTLQVVTYATNGEASNPATISIRVGGKVALVPAATPTVTAPPPDAPDLAIVSVEAVVAGYKGEVPFCNTRVTYRNAGTAAVPRDFTIQFHFNGVPQLAMTVAGGLPPGASAEATFVYQFDGSPYIGINLDSTDVIAESNEANNAFAEIRLCSGAPPPPEATATPTGTQTPTATGTSTPTPTITQEPPTPTSTFTPTPTIPPPPPPGDWRIWVDNENVKAGSCTTVRWHVSNVNAYWVDGQPGAGDDGSFQTCPCQDETHTLRVAKKDGSEQTLSVTIRVSGQCQAPPPPQDTTPPPVPSPAVPADGLEIGCKASQTLAWMPVSDPSGVVYYVKLERQVSPGNWQSVRGWGPVSGKQVEAEVQCGSIYRWTVRAQDGAGNYSDWSSWSRFSIRLP